MNTDDTYSLQRATHTSPKVTLLGFFMCLHPRQRRRFVFVDEWELLMWIVGIVAPHLACGKVEVEAERFEGISAERVDFGLSAA